MEKVKSNFMDCFEDDSFMNVEKNEFVYEDITHVVESILFDVYDCQNDIRAIIHLDKSTAIEFTKKLITEIGKIKG
jgi:hypothetical protein